ncbi:hypothetical protein HDE_07793 [Halotydeus destructor]|nr:hypothetical protein HDE_07793 [Halotydeus destructor]
MQSFAAIVLVAILATASANLVSPYGAHYGYAHVPVAQSTIYHNQVHYAAPHAAHYAAPHVAHYAAPYAAAYAAPYAALPYYKK